MSNPSVPPGTPETARLRAASINGKRRDAARAKPTGTRATDSRSWTAADRAIPIGLDWRRDGAVMPGSRSGSQADQWTACSDGSFPVSEHDLMSLSRRRNALKRYRTDDDPVLIEADRAAREAGLEQHIRKVVDAAPPLTDEQLGRLAAILRPSLDRAAA